MNWVLGNIIYFQKITELIFNRTQSLYPLSRVFLFCNSIVTWKKKIIILLDTFFCSYSFNPSLTLEICDLKFSCNNREKTNNVGFWFTLWCMKIIFYHICIGNYFVITIKWGKMYLHHFSTIEMPKVIIIGKIIMYSYYMVQTEYLFRITRHREHKHKHQVAQFL